MPIPNYRALPGGNDLQKVDWEDKGIAKAALIQLQTDLKWNSSQRQTHLKQCYKDAVQLVDGLEGIITDLKSMSGRGNVVIPAATDVKRDRMIVKALMTEAVGGETTYFNAMKDFRGGSNFGLPDKFETAVKTIRGATQTVDKAISRVPPELKALEVRASAAIKTINVLLSRYGGAQKVVEKMEASWSKLANVQKGALTNASKVASSVSYIKKNMENKDKKIETLVLAMVTDLSKNGSELKANVMAVQKTAQALKALRKGTEGTRWNMRATKIFDDGNGLLRELLPLLDTADKEVKGLQKEKKLDKAVKAKLPKTIK